MTTKEKYRASIKNALKLSVPIVTGQLGLVLMGFFDTVQVGGLGAVYMAASGVSNSVYFLFTLLGMGILFSVSPLVSEAFGEQHTWKSVGVFKSGAIVSLALSVIFYLLMLAVIHHFAFFRESERITGFAQSFLTILNYSTPMLMFFTLGKQFMDGMGRTRVSMTITLVGLVCNVFLNWVLIYGKLGLPALGIQGAAIATATSRTLMCLILYAYIFNDKKVRTLIGQFMNEAHAGISKNYVPQILRIGIPSGLQVFFEVAAFGASQIMSGWLGDNSLAAFQVAINLASITFMMVSGLAAAGTIMTGYAYGARDKEQVKIAGNTIYLITFCVQLFFAAVFLLLHSRMPLLYTNDSYVINLASSLLILAAIFQLSDGFQVVGVSLLRGIQDVRIPSVMAFASYWLIMVPSGYLLAFHFGLQVKGIWIGFIIGLTVAALLMYARFRYKLQNIQFTDL
jgi:multidrug resistance protein, MATE family